MHRKQHTIKKDVSLKGVGLHTGAEVTMTFKPAPENHGYVFQRVDLESQPLVHALVDHVVDTSRGTTIAENGAKVYTVEHTLAALVGQGVDNVLIQLDGPEPPIMDGSSKDFLSALQKAGKVEQTADLEVFVIENELSYEEPDREVALKISPANSFHASVLIDYDSQVLEPQEVALNNIDEFPESFADARTFCFLHELEAMVEAGLIKGGDLNNAIVLVDREITDEEMERLCKIFDKPKLQVKQGVLNNVGLRYDNEPARHKMLDLVGDLALVGMPVQGQVVASRPGHKANVELAKRIRAQIKHKMITDKYQPEKIEGAVFDINAITKILPHRYPFLLVDKILSFSENTITGLKNVTVNEPFFQGHFPGNPIMPGVLQLEAMAQVGGILLLNTLEVEPQDVWVYFVAIDNARFKKPVIPGDTLILELEMVALKRGICKMKGKATVDGKLVSSAELVASVVPKNKS